MTCDCDDDAGLAPAAPQGAATAPGRDGAAAPGRDGTGRWQGRVALVTDAGKGLGQCIARELAQAGATVVVTGLNAADLAETVDLVADARGEAVPLLCDAMNPEMVADVARTVCETFGGIDLLINNAGAGAGDPVDAAMRADPHAWWDAFETNALAGFLCMHAILPGMIGRRRSAIVTIVGPTGIDRRSNGSVCPASESALIRLTENVAAEAKPHGISVFAYYPGLPGIPLPGIPLPGTPLPGTPLPETPLPETPAIAPQTAPLADIKRSLDALMRLIGGDYDVLSGCYVAVDDDLDALRRRVEAGGRG